MASEFGELARSHELKFLCFLLEMVVEEAVHQSRIAAGSPPVSTMLDDAPQKA
jgi:hypothetical protein